MNTPQNWNWTMFSVIIALLASAGSLVWNVALLACRQSGQIPDAA